METDEIVASKNAATDEIITSKGVLTDEILSSEGEVTDETVTNKGTATDKSVPNTSERIPNESASTDEVISKDISTLNIATNTTGADETMGLTFTSNESDYPITSIGTEAISVEEPPPPPAAQENTSRLRIATITAAILGLVILLSLVFIVILAFIWPRK